MFAQSYKLHIETETGTETVTADSVQKITFITNRAQALNLTDKNGRQVESDLLTLKKIRFTEMNTQVKNNTLRQSQKKSFKLMQNFPNPFNPRTTLVFDTPVSGAANVQILNMRGQTVRTLFNQQIQAGVFQLEWLGENDLGQPVGSGLYLYRVRINDSVQMKKMLYLK
ncbi:T9SS type A sorting domain-containing protein [candidate division KSB1 bacterium]|nr:T9SS type A sorting domain-containing protein [candidate division KSB1 bacterium]